MVTTISRARLSREEAHLIYRAKRLFALAVVTFIIYAAYSVWRLKSVEEYQDALQAKIDQDSSVENALSQFYATSTGLMYLNYATLFIFSLAIAICAWRGVNVRDRNLIRWHIGGSLGCVAILIFTFVNLGIVGNLCLPTSTNCNSLQLIYGWSIAICSILTALYLLSTYYAWRIVSSPAFDMVLPELVRVDGKELLSSSFWFQKPFLDPEQADYPQHRVTQQVSPTGELPVATPVYVSRQP